MKQNKVYAIDRDSLLMTGIKGNIFCNTLDMPHKRAAMSNSETRRLRWVLDRFSRSGAPED
jgi:hypothetical protein